jgi:hypothetical protein
MIALGLLVVCLLCDRFKPRQQLEASNHCVNELSAINVSV